MYTSRRKPGISWYRTCRPKCCQLGMLQRRCWLAKTSQVADDACRQCSEQVCPPRLVLRAAYCFPSAGLRLSAVTRSRGVPRIVHSLNCSSCLAGLRLNNFIHICMGSTVTRVTRMPECVTPYP